MYVWEDQSVNYPLYVLGGRELLCKLMIKLWKESRASTVDLFHHTLTLCMHVNVTKIVRNSVDLTKMFNKHTSLCLSTFALYQSSNHCTSRFGGFVYH